MSQDYLVSLTKRVSCCEKDGQNPHRHTHLKFDSNVVQCNKDLVCNGYIVSSLCSPNRLVYTNQHKQLVSTNLSDVVRGNNINIVSNGDGTITVANPQNISQSSSPSFQRITVTNQPVNLNDVTTKQYVDDKLSMLESGVFDVKSAQINLTSTKNAESLSTGALVIAGGMGVTKDLYVGGGLHLPNSDGILTKLDYFEEGTLSISWDNIWSNPISSTFAYQRIGKWVMLMFPYSSHMATRRGIIFNTTDTYLPPRLQPLYDITHDVGGSDNSSDIPVCATIYGDNGRITIKPKNASEYSGSGICGFNTFSISYMAKI